MDALIHLVIVVLLFALVGAALWFICTRFFGGNQVALWICGAVLLIVLLFLIASFSGYGGSNVYPLRR